MLSPFLRSVAKALVPNSSFINALTEQLLKDQDRDLKHQHYVRKGEPLKSVLAGQFS